MTELLVTPELVEEWKTQRRALLDEAAALDRRVKAACVLLGIPEQTAAAVRATERPTNMQEAIRRIVGLVDGPITYRGLRTILMDEGFPPHRLGNYLYTAVSRLRLAGEITMDENKQISRRVA